VSTVELLLERKTAPVKKTDYGRTESAVLITQHSSIRKKLAVTSPMSGGCSVSIVRSRTKAAKSTFVVCYQPLNIQAGQKPIVVLPSV
jgi:hypothetical protein